MIEKVNIFIIWIYHFCSTCILYESIPLYIITSYVTIQYTSEHCSFSFTYSDIIWLTNYYSRSKSYNIKMFNLIILSKFFTDSYTCSHAIFIIRTAYWESFNGQKFCGLKSDRKSFPTKVVYFIWIIDNQEFTISV